jgi:hypothetical protein
MQLTPRPDGDPVATVERAAAEAGLTVTLRGTLAAYPGCTYWHLKRGREPGTLEVTWWPQTGRLWFKVANNRHGWWIEDARRLLANRIEAG